MAVRQAFFDYTSVITSRRTRIRLALCCAIAAAPASVAAREGDEAGVVGLLRSDYRLGWMVKTGPHDPEKLRSKLQVALDRAEEVCGKRESHDPLDLELVIAASGRVSKIEVAESGDAARCLGQAIEATRFARARGATRVHAQTAAPGGLAGPSSPSGLPIPTEYAPAGACALGSLDLQGAATSRDGRGLALRQIRARIDHLGACEDGAYDAELTVEPGGKVKDVRVRGGRGASCVADVLRSAAMFIRPVATQFAGTITIDCAAEAGGWGFGDAGTGPGSAGTGLGTIGLGRPGPELDANGVFADRQGQVRIELRGGTKSARLRSLLARQAPAILSCWDEQRPFSDALSGPLVIDVLIAARDLSEARTVRALDPNIDACVTSVLRRAYFEGQADTIERLSFTFAGN